MYDLETMKNTPLDCANADSLVDIASVSVDKSLSREARIIEFIRQIKNPYCFRCGNFIVKARFADNGVSLEDCLQGILM